MAAEDAGKAVVPGGTGDRSSDREVIDVSKAPYRIRKRGESWMTDFFLAGKRVRKAFETKEEAEGWILTQRAGALQGASPSTTTKPVVSLKFEEMASLMLDDLHRLARSSETLNDYADRLARLAIPHIGDTPVRAITRKTIQDLIAKLHGMDYSAGEMNRGLAIVRRTLQWAVDHDHVDSNVAASIRRIPAPPHREPAFLTEEEQAAILSRLKAQAYGLILTALRTGMRRKELRFFNFAWVDFERDTISVPYTIDFKPNGKRRRSIPLAPTSGTGCSRSGGPPGTCSRPGATTSTSVPSSARSVSYAASLSPLSGRPASRYVSTTSATRSPQL